MTTATPGPLPAGQPLHEWIADDLRSAIARGDYPRGAQLPTESALVAQYGAARGTVRAALAALSMEGLLASRRGTPRIVLGATISQSFSELRSFAQWAWATGRSPGGHFVTRVIRPAEPIESQALGIGLGEDICYTVRVRSLDGEPIFVERSAYPLWVAETIMSLDEDCPSLTASLEELVGLVLASGTHTIDVGRADPLDAELLGIADGDPVLRRRGTTRRSDGTPCEYTEDRYIERSASFTLHNSVASNPLSRQVSGP